MRLSKLRRLFVGCVVAVLALLGVPAAGAAPTSVSPPPPVNVQVVTYDASQAGEFAPVIDQGARIWNESAHNVRLQPGPSAEVTVVADDGWPRAQTDGLGAGMVWIGRQAVNQGYDTTRIASHELGHILGLPDQRTGRCEELMSGNSAPIECKKARPNPPETAEVDQNFANGRMLPRQVFVDTAPAAAPR